MSFFCLFVNLLRRVVALRRVDFSGLAEQTTPMHMHALHSLKIIIITIINKTRIPIMITITDNKYLLINE